MRFKMPRDFYIPKHSQKVSDKLSDAVAYLSTNSKDKPRATVFFGNQAKPVADYWYRDEACRAAAVGELFVSRRKSLAFKNERREARKAGNRAAATKVQVGDIYRTSWGYDQTNVEFFEVVAVKGQYATLREIAQAREGGGPTGYRVVPQSGEYLKPRFEGDDAGQPIRRLIQDGYIKICDVRHAWPWGKRDPITGTVIGEAAYATDSMFGH